MIHSLRKNLHIHGLFVFFIFLLSGTPAAAQNQNAVVVELFTSEGCSSCPPADSILRALTKEAKEKNLPILTLSFHVDYWNYLGWPDPYSQAQFTKRQRQYAQKLKSKSVYTPQMVVNGLHGFGGYKQDLAQRYITEQLAEENDIQLSLADFSRKTKSIEFSYSLSKLPKNSLINIALVNRHNTQNVTRGENAGRILEHANVVANFKTFDLNKTEGMAKIDLPTHMDIHQASIVVYIQDKNTMEILTASKADLDA